MNFIIWLEWNDGLCFYVVFHACMVVHTVMVFLLCILVSIPSNSCALIYKEFITRDYVYGWVHFVVVNLISNFMHRFRRRLVCCILWVAWTWVTTKIWDTCPMRWATSSSSLWYATWLFVCVCTHPVGIVYKTQWFISGDRREGMGKGHGTISSLDLTLLWLLTY